MVRDEKQPCAATLRGGWRSGQGALRSEQVALRSGQAALRGGRVALRISWLTGLAWAGLSGCGGGGSTPAADAPADTAAPPWWQPRAGEVKNWDIQLAAPIDTTAPRVMYQLDLWALVPAPTTLDYGDGSPVAVPAGALAGRIAELHARTPPAIVICHVETGALELSRPDASKFPGYNANPAAIPDDPAAPAAGSVIGWSVVPGMRGVRLLDIREASRAAWAPIMFKRFDLAKQIGCDGISPDHNYVVQYASGFDVTVTDSYSWYAEVASQGHARMLSTGMKNGHRIPGQVDRGADEFDWLVVDRCGEFDDCDLARPFLDRGKPVFALDYDHDIDGVAQSSTAACTRQTLATIADGLYKDVALTRNIRTQCVP
jgi:Glycoside-hydrolase family GH114